MKVPNQEKLAALEAANLSSARIILKDVQKYGGEQSLAVQFARATITKETTCKAA